MRYPLIAVALMATGALAVAGCGGGSKKSASTPATTAAPAQTTTSAAPSPAPTAGLTIGETEYKLTPSQASAKSGSVTISIKNSGAIVHSLEVQGNGVTQKTGNINPGSSGTLKVTLKPGTYQMFCPIDGHKALGMKGTIVVK
jgi:uncharacterized cupredoxin-like copper-binding protein